MENEMELSTERPSLLILNEYCLLEIFKFIELDDSMNLAECCNRLRRVADRAVKLKSKFVLDGNMFRKEDDYIDRVFTHIGHVSRLAINCLGINPNLSKIISHWNNLKSLQIRNWNGNKFRVDSTVHNFDKIELLSLWNCNLRDLKMFLKNFYKLKFLTIDWCHSRNKLITALINNNPEMESLCCLGLQPDTVSRIFQLLERIPKVKRLGLEIFYRVTSAELNSLLTLNGLTKLQLVCNHRNNINNVLSGLARNGIMEEMELDGIEIDDNFFDILKSFVRLQLLIILQKNDIWKLKSSTIWPTNLKRLRLDNIEFTRFSFISTIQQLKSLGYMDIEGCTIPESDVTDFKNVAKLSRNILNAMDHGNRKQRLEVILPIVLLEGDVSKTNLLVDSKPLRILINDLNPAIEVDFPDGFFWLEFNP